MTFNVIIITTIWLFLITIKYYNTLAHFVNKAQLLILDSFSILSLESTHPKCKKSLNSHSISNLAYWQWHMFLGHQLQVSRVQLVELQQGIRITLPQQDLVKEISIKNKDTVSTNDSNGNSQPKSSTTRMLIADPYLEPVCQAQREWPLE